MQPLIRLPVHFRICLSTSPLPPISSHVGGQICSVGLEKPQVILERRQVTPCAL